MIRRNRCQSIGKRDCPNVPIGKGLMQGSTIWLVPSQSVQNTSTLRQAPVWRNYPGGIAENSTNEGWRQKKNESDNQYFARFACSWEDKTSRTLTQKSVMISEPRTEEGTRTQLATSDQRSKWRVEQLDQDLWQDTVDPSTPSSGATSPQFATHL